MLTRTVAGSLATLATMALAAAPAHAQDPPNLDVHFVPTPNQVVERMLDMAKVTKSDFVIDLGSGDGRIPIAAAKRHGARGMGVDLDPQRISEAQENLRTSGVGDRVTFHQQNLFETDLSKATVITMYLLPSLNIKLRPILLDLKPGTRLASHAFDMGDWRPDRHDIVDGRNAYLWIVPAKVGGKWNVTDGPRTYTIELTQQYQIIEGTAKIGESNFRLQEAALRGDEIRFVIDGPDGRHSYVGRVSGDRIAAVQGAGGRPWRAERGS
ncbi:MAG: class I SAM-dependent methyltransferase [Gemmatimonadales bacterium]|nr:class I SAM-dependent methyltransferase [Gemmatimonadales bacterium]